MSSDYREKLRLIRKAEGLTQAAVAEETGIALSSIRNYESGGVAVGLKVIEKFLAMTRFQKYTLWLMTGQTAPESGQIAPKGAEEITSEDDIASATKEQTS
ncbi:helix-turn-helix domain-containing protein [Erwinia rhapontici]|uniref:helix-turn-helix domain-containing protein n=1 Tax=Erwinia rhapontici TaxID=55212 RepID=UPI001D0DBA22|nr:helix-turn-helix transcriptional regulator [Erwinia rhapontici]UDQ80178.1 helix-turn-helix domain-containing protein [Erwinia rhapontici]